MRYEELVPRTREKLSTVHVYYLEGRRITRQHDAEDFSVIENSLLVWCGMLLDLVSLMPSFCSETMSMLGRYYSNVYSAVTSVPDSDIKNTLGFLDDLYSCILHGKDQQSHFKGGRPFAGSDMKSCVASHPLKQLFSYLTNKWDQCGGMELGDQAAALRCYLSVIRFPKKLPIDRSDLEEEMENEYIENEARLRSVDQSLDNPFELTLTTRLNTLARKVFEGFSIDQLHPKHGPGRVSIDGVTSRLDKYLNMNYDRRIDLLLQWRGLGSYNDYLPFSASSRCNRTAKFICVPKTWKTLRGISAEPPELQYFQQAVLFGIDQYFHKSRFWKERVDLHNQVENQRLARIGSIDQSLATIDLSKASDSVTLKLVKRIFKGTELLPWLLATRSTHVDLKTNGVQKISKFAPMGSSTCFPVECIVFTLIAELARLDCMRVIGESLPIPRIYGDDIVCASLSTPILFRYLDSLGFIVNTTKSYWTGNFRESCGKEYWHGYDISPVYYRLEMCRTSNHIQHDALTGAVQLYNSLYLLGFDQARRVLFSFLSEMKIRIPSGDRFRSVPVLSKIMRTFTGEGGTLVSSQPTNFQLKKSVHHGIRQMRALAWHRKALYDFSRADSELAEYVSYFDWFLTARRKRDSVILDSNIEDHYWRLPLDEVMVPSIKARPCFHLAESQIG